MKNVAGLKFGRQIFSSDYTYIPIEVTRYLLPHHVTLTTLIKYSNRILTDAISRLSYSMESNKMLLNIVCIIAAAALRHVNAEEPERIIGAIDAENHEFPATVSIRVNSEHWCGGALVSDTHVLTAAHCIVPIANQPYDHVTVVSGSNYLSIGGVTSNVTEYFYHSEFLPSQVHGKWSYDIGMLKLAAPLTLNAEQNTIRLPSKNPPAGKFAVVSGWGKTNLRGDVMSESLQKQSFKIISTKVCQKYFPRPIRNIMICTLNGEDVGVCRGDSGSPLMFKNKIIGIVSGGIPCALGYPDIYTNVYKYLDQIQTWMAL